MSANIHKAFAGYLCVLYTATQLKRTDKLQPRFKDFFDQFLLVTGAPKKAPYFVPFGSPAPLERFWFNRNVAGSYAPSSLRSVSPLRQILTIEGSGVGTTFSLRTNHASLAKFLLLNGSTAPGTSLAAFIYRDFGINPGDTDPNSLLFSLLQHDFGFPFDNASASFESLFNNDFADVSPQLQQLAGAS